MRDSTETVYGFGRSGVMNIIGFINDFNASYDKHINLLKYESVKQISESIDYFINDQLIDGETFNLPKFKKTNSKFKIKIII